MKKESNNRNQRINLESPPLGIKVLSESINGYEDINLFEGVSYCQALFKAASGNELLLKPGSIKVCKWSPVVLGFKEGESKFEKSLKEHLPPTAGIYMAPLHMFRNNLNPDVVIIRTNSENFDSITKALGWDSFIDPEPYDQDLTALQLIKSPSRSGSARWLIRNLNKWLHWFYKFDRLQSFSYFVFNNDLMSRVFNPFFTKYTANQSMCRNSTVVPLLNGKANISFFCPGGVTWGRNSPLNMTSGYPYKIFQKLESWLDYPGKNMRLL